MNTDQLITIIQTSEDPWELLDASKALARDGDPKGHAALARAVTEDRFLSHLDTPEDYEGVSINLRLMSLMKAVAENGAPSAVAVLTSASRSKVYEAHTSRIDVLIDAWSLVRPSPPPAIEFWDRYGHVDDGYVERSMLRMAENGSDPALALMEKKLTAPEFEESHRAYWLRRYAIMHRDNPTMLRACRRMVAGSIEPALRPTVVEILFDFQPKSWYAAHDVPTIPSRAGASRAALELLREIGATGRAALALPPDLDAKVRLELRAIEQRLENTGP